ncbi:MAG TPA: serine/threonine-protein kinase [Polyangiaceae bacterium]|nr:serine/threonine-protein kinase [Polyangiaceae bacterium]
MALLLEILLLGPLLLACWLLASSGRFGSHDGRQRPDGALSAPQRLGPYTLGSKLGEGAMGEVYRAWNSAVGAWHAVKLLPRDATPNDRRRFEKEARLGAQVRHPNTVSILEPARDGDGTCYYAMELLEGTSLQQLVEREGPQPPARVARILRQLSAALAEMHAQGLVHRDIKPDNVLLTGRGDNSGDGSGADVCKLIDFGLVEHVGALAERQPEGTLIGTPLYISPEAILAPETVGPRSDLYGLGAVGYFLLRGEPVFRGSSLIEVCCHHLHTVPEALPMAPGDAVAAELASIVLACLAKDPSERPASAAEVARRLARPSEVPSLPNRRATRVRPSLAPEAECRTAHDQRRIAA